MLNLTPQEKLREHFYYDEVIGKSLNKLPSCMKLENAQAYSVIISRLIDDPDIEIYTEEIDEIVKLAIDVVIADKSGFKEFDLSSLGNLNLEKNSRILSTALFVAARFKVQFPFIYTGNMTFS